MAAACETHRHLAGAGVAGDVGERLLHDPVEVELALAAERLGERGGGQPTRQAVAPRELADVGAQRVLEPEPERAPPDGTRGRGAPPTRSCRRWS